MHNTTSQIRKQKLIKPITEEKLNIKINEVKNSMHLKNSTDLDNNEILNNFLSENPVNRMSFNKDIKSFIGSGAGGRVIKLSDKLVCKIIDLPNTCLKKFENCKENNFYDFLYKEISYQILVYESITPEITPKIHDYYFYKFNNYIYGIIIMDYLKDYIKFSDFKESLHDKNKKEKEKFFDNYHKSLDSLISEFLKLKIFISDFQFMLKKDGSDIKLIDFGSVGPYKRNVALTEGDSDFDELPIMFSNIHEHIEFIKKHYDLKRSDIDLKVPTTRTTRTTTKRYRDSDTLDKGSTKKRGGYNKTKTKTKQKRRTKRKRFTKRRRLTKRRTVGKSSRAR